MVTTAVPAPQTDQWLDEVADRGDRWSTPAGGDGDHGGRVPVRHLYLVPDRPSTGTFWRRRMVVLACLVLLAMALVAGVGQLVTSGDLSDRVDGHVVIEPGQTLWDVARATAPVGMDARQHLADIEDLNGIAAEDVREWSVVLLPAR